MLSETHFQLSKFSVSSASILRAQSRIAAQKRLEEELSRSSASLISFTRAAWHILEPGVEYKHGWHLDCLAEHLEAVTRGQITRLLVNVPPGTTKSMTIGVMWPAWEWGPRNMASMRYLGTSHEQSLAIRDSLKMRRLVESEWYQERWPVQLTGDQNQKTKFENTATGFREAMAFTSLTGSRGDRLLMDDVLSVNGAFSDTKREAVNTTFRESVTTRLNDAQRSAIIVVMQRLHEYDVSGLILEKEFGYTHICLPMEFEPDRRCVTSIGFSDPRKDAGELLFPQRFPREVVERDKAVLGPYAAAAQFQQRPAPAGGGLFKRQRAEVIPVLPAGIRFQVRGWDFASSTEDGAAYTAGVKIGQCPDGSYVVADVLREQLSPFGVDRALKNTASSDGSGTTIDVPTDPGQAGKDSMRHRVTLLSGYTVKTSPETGSKLERAQPFASQWEAGNVRVLSGPWNEAYFAELESFPRGRYADQVDASSRAFNRLTKLADETVTAAELSI